MEKLKASKKYDLYFDYETNCFRLLEYDPRYPYYQGRQLLTIPKSTLIDLIIDHQGEI